MSQLKQTLFFSLIGLIFSCEFSPTSDNDLTGSAAVNISLGKIGSLQKSKSNISIGLKNLVVKLNATDEKDIIDTISLDGTSQITISKCYDNLTPKLWTLSATSFDQAGEIIHSGSTTFTIIDNDTTKVSLNLASAFSKLKLHIFPIPEAAMYAKIYLNNYVIIDSTPIARPDTAKFLYNYITVGDQKEIKCEIYGSWNGIANTLLYTGTTKIEPKSGIDQFYKMTLIYVGPTRVPSGSLSATITLGNTGTEYIEASVKEENIPENDLYCFYPFSGNALDVSGNNHHATVYGPQLTTDRFGKPQSAYSFDGVDDYIISGVMEDFPGNNSSKSVTGWFRSSVVNPYIMMLFGFGNSQHEYNFQGGIGPDYMSGGTVFRLNGWDDNADWRIGTLALEYLDGAWHFCAFTYDGDTAKFYLDGKLQNKTINYNYNTNSNQSRIIIGREIDLSGWEFKGDIDDVRVYSKEISETEVQALYNDKP